jgi:hypothetical protein
MRDDHDRCLIRVFGPASPSAAIGEFRCRSGLRLLMVLHSLTVFGALVSPARPRLLDPDVVYSCEKSCSTLISKI